jgi:hypothetical protein
MAAARPRTNLQNTNAILTAELAQIGLKPGATADQINQALQRRWPHGTGAPPIDPATGLPYTPATAKAAGSGQALGQIAGGAALGLTVGGIVDSLIAALRGGAAFEGATGGFDATGTTGGAAATGGADIAGAGGGAAGAAGLAAGAGVGLLGGISNTLDFLKWIAWIFHPLNLLRAVEFITGIATMFYGLHTLMGVMRRGSATHRTTLGSVFSWTPWGRELRFAKARKRGKRAGEIQAERDVAYRGARQERSKAIGVKPRTTPGSGGTGGTGQGSSALE